MILFAVLLVVSYCLGCINTSIIYSLCRNNKDIRTQGSGNAGATNMLRSYGKTGAIITFLGDILKVVIAIGIAWFVYRNSVHLDLIKTLMGFACVLGHCFPVFFQFKGGKGITTGSGCILMLDWRVFIVAIALFALIVVLTKYVSLGSIVGAMMYPIGMIFVAKPLGAIIVPAITAALVIYRHKKNVIALFKGTERKIGTPKTADK